MAQTRNVGYFANIINNNLKPVVIEKTPPPPPPPPQQPVEKSMAKPETATTSEKMGWIEIENGKIKTCSYWLTPQKQRAIEGLNKGKTTKILYKQMF